MKRFNLFPYFTFWIPFKLFLTCKLHAIAYKMNLGTRWEIMCQCLTLAIVLAVETMTMNVRFELACFNVQFLSMCIIFSSNSPLSGQGLGRVYIAGVRTCACWEYESRCDELDWGSLHPRPSTLICYRSGDPRNGCHAVDSQQAEKKECHHMGCKHYFIRQWTLYIFLTMFMQDLR